MTMRALLIAACVTVSAPAFGHSVPQRGNSPPRVDASPEVSGPPGAPNQEAEAPPPEKKPRTGCGWYDDDTSDVARWIHPPVNCNPNP